jgi:hypothetical protein
MSKAKWILFGIASLIAIALIATATVPSLRSNVRGYLAKTDHDVLATAEGDLIGDGSLIKVIKIRSDEGLFVEVLKLDANGGSTLIDRILLPDKHDGMFNYQGHVTRLAITDIDNDGKTELLAPSFDNQLVPHLNVFKYNATTGRFEIYQPPSSSQ